MKRAFSCLMSLAIVITTLFGFSSQAHAVMSKDFLYCPYATEPSVSLPTDTNQVVSVEYHNPDASKSADVMGAVFSKYPNTTAGGYKNLGPVFEDIKPGESVFTTAESDGYPYATFIYDSRYGADAACVRVSVTASPKA